MGKLYAIWDIDNCLSDDEWRLKYVDWSQEGDKRYFVYNTHSMGDPLFHRREFEVFVKMGAEPVFMSGRPEMMRDQTVEWLELKLRLSGYHPEKSQMFLRGNGTVGLSPRKCKEVMLANFKENHMKVGDRIVGAFDDLPCVVDMYRHHGIPAAVLAIHNKLEKAYAPSDLV